MTISNIYFIDSRVADPQLIDSLPPDSEWFLLHPDQDGVEQMQKILSGYSGLNSIQIVSHGAPGALYLGSILLSQSNIDQYRDKLSDIGNSLTPTGDILLYGCNVAEGEQGHEFITSLAQLTGADVAASSDVTGNSGLGGNWNLESTVGVVQTAVQPLAYEGLLGMTVSPEISPLS